MLYLTGFASLFASVAVVHRAVCARSSGPAALRPAPFPVGSGCQLGARPAPNPEREQPRPQLPADVPPGGGGGSSSSRCLGDNETAEERRRGGVTATALYLWGSVMTALSYPKAPDLAPQRSPPHAPLRKVPNACERSNRTAPAAAPRRHGPFGLDALPAPPALHCRACSAATGPVWAKTPNREDWLDPLGLRQCSLHTALDLGRIKSFIFPS